MPLARIVTRSPEDTTAASEYLRSNGYTVETVSPEEFRVTPAELELHLEKCRPEEALERARKLLESPTAVASPQPEAVPAQPEKPKVAVAYDIAGRPVEFVEEEEILSERRQRPGTIVRALVSMFARGKRGIASCVTGVWKSVRKPAAEFQQRRAEQRALELEAELAREREEIRHEEELARERLQQEMELQREEAELAERQRHKRIAAEKEAGERRIAAERVAAEECQRMEAEHAAALAAQQEQARVDAEPQAAALRAEQEATITAQPQQARVDGRPETSSVGASEILNPILPRTPEPAPQQKSAAPKPAARQQLPSQRARGTQPFLVRRRKGPIAISGKAVATAFGASLLLLLGFVAYANRRPASPLTPGNLMRNRSLTQDTPFGTAVITPTPAAPKPSAAVAAPAKPSAAANSKTSKPRPAQPKARRLRPQSQNNSVAEDEVVVRHLQAPRSRPQPTSSSAKLKQYSDAE